jgi:hypothetical protein
MTEAHKQHISKLRNHGLGYTTIASRLGLTKDCVRSYCRTHGLTGKYHPLMFNRIWMRISVKTCGRLLRHTSGKRKKFCSNSCCMDWWNTHSDQVNQKSTQGQVRSFCLSRTAEKSTVNSKRTKPSVCKTCGKKLVPTPSIM